MNLDPFTLNIVLGLLVPVLVGVATRQTTSSAVKSMCNVLLSAVVGGMVTLNELGDAADVKVVIQGIFFTFATSIVSYYGFMKPSGFTDKVQDKTKHFGL